MSDIVTYEVRGRTALITLNRPEARNAVNGDVAAGMEAAIDRMEADDDVWVGVIQANTEGQSKPVFCAGADLKAINSGDAASLATAKGGFAGFVYRDRKKPVIVAVDGLATAGGCEIVLAADMVVATTRSAFGLAEAKRLGERVRDGTRTLAVALAPGTSPLTGEPMFALPPGEAFIGMGVHGEPGFARMPSYPLDAVCDRVMDGLIEDGEYVSDETVGVFVNGSGGTSLMELLAASRSVFRRLEREGIQHVAPLIGSYVTTQETKGFSVSLCRFDDTDLRRWTAPSDVPFFHL